MHPTEAAFPLWNRKALICVKVDIRIGQSF
jgi:hypothetical protein